ncbi:hypothetical protein [Aliikangiella maris]|uniref:PH domain-containing protein n=2 Tax=Aliikangiella maris TaxID=3162458 RepID=A0ABV2BVF0_9GAMM
MFNHISIKKRNRLELILTRSKIKAVLELCFYTTFFGFWYTALIDDFSSFNTIKQDIITKVSEQKMLIVFFIAPLFFAKRILLNVNTIISGNEYTFNSTRKKIYHNGKEVCHYHQVENIQIRRIYNSEDSDSYMLTIIYSGMKKFFIAESSDSSYIKEIAASIADACDTKVEYKD